MDAARSSDEIRTVRDARIDGLRAEASEAVGYSANTLRAVSQRYRTQYLEEVNRWQALRDELHSLERGASARRRQDPDEPAQAAEAGAEAERIRALRNEVDGLGTELGRQQAEVSRLEIALRNLESTWLFLEPGDVSLINGGEGLAADVQMRIVEAQESERSRLAQEVHDGPAQTLSNAIFQVEYIERVLDVDPPSARTELRLLSDLLRRELDSVRTFISQLRPPVLDELGLDGALSDAIERTTALTGLGISTEFGAPADRLTGTQQTVVLRVLQEALQNVRKHGAASAVTVSTGIEPDDWVLTVRDDGRGFDVGAVAARGRRNFGLQFMRERAELIGARFEVHSRPNGGTIVRLAIPLGTEEST
ncbi:MAG TPA: sensor histidine kinase [Patescibacteria group bacterium]|nr:sensor histidine kinase [Patescibacteria group bacterium]